MGTAKNLYFVTTLCCSQKMPFLYISQMPRLHFEFLEALSYCSHARSISAGMFHGNIDGALQNEIHTKAGSLVYRLRGTSIIS